MDTPEILDIRTVVKFPNALLPGLQVEKFLTASQELPVLKMPPVLGAVSVQAALRVPEGLE